jgi:hypothetical protein
MSRLLHKLLNNTWLKNKAGSTLRKRGAPLHAGLVIHSEKIQDISVYNQLLALKENLRFRPLLCVMTPENPYIRADMHAKGCSENEFNDRLLRLQQSYDIGLHGHWCREKKAGESLSLYKKGRETYIEAAGFPLTMHDAKAVQKQFSQEYSYLKAIGCHPPAYSAGWWFFNDVIADLLDEYGFGIDCSVNKTFTDSFGTPVCGKFTQKTVGDIHYFTPKKRTASIISLSYIHYNWWSLIEDILTLLFKKDQRHVVFPLHDYDLPKYSEKIRSNITFLHRISGVNWCGVPQMLNGKR